MKGKISKYNQNIFKELIEKYPEMWGRLNYVNKDKWLTKEKLPTYNQLVEIAKTFNIPFGYLFLEKFPERKIQITHFRTNHKSTYNLSPELYETILQVGKQQEWIKDILLEWGQKPLPYAGIFDVNSDKQIVVKQMRQILKLENTWAQEKISWDQAFRYLVQKFEEAGIFVVINGVVGNNTHKKLKVEDFRGFVLYDNIAPFVFINNNDFISAKIFTLLHEFVHILVGRSASFDLRNLQSADDEVEKFCDKSAAEFLVPTREIQNIRKIDDYDKLSKKFKVSPIVIARRLLDLEKISKEEFFEFYNEFKKKDKRPVPAKGGDFYSTAILRYGKAFLELLHFALQNGQILYRDYYHLLSLKPATAEKILRHYL